MEKRWGAWRRFFADRDGATTIEYAAAAAAIALLAAFAAQATGFGVGSAFDRAVAKLRDAGVIGVAGEKSEAGMAGGSPAASSTMRP
ncbi:MAG: hypothetical protein IPL47_12050 [Phyllobacteriaceae bacterium]|nr:hypothetical protein [Phyllobacteriaceae bacterium]